MRTEVVINGSASAAARYLGWAPVPAQVRLVETIGASGPAPVTLRNRDTTRGGQVVFFDAVPGQPRSELRLTLPLTGAPVDVHLAGWWQRPSIRDGDAAVEVVHASGRPVLGVTPLMVRVRKDAETLTTEERNRVLAAFATFNNRGMGRFSDFRNAHTTAADREAHGFTGFLPWHRAFLLDLERELQRIDPSVALPYWRFDRPAPRLFSTEFMGVADGATGTVRFSAANPLQFWATDGTPGIVRRPRFNPQVQPINADPERFTVMVLGGPDQLYSNFRRMELNPHASAHNSFTGFITNIGTAARDPLFFLLHANVDRLWAQWQVIHRRFDGTSTRSFSRPGSASGPGDRTTGHNLNDTMWPWNQVTTPPRPPTAPGGGLAPSPLTSAPGPRPTVGAMIDYQGTLTSASSLWFDYDNVPFVR